MPKTTTRECLLRIACLGNAEKTIQGELLAYLRSVGIFAISEAGFRKKNSASPPATVDRHIDILVFRKKDNAQESAPIVAIELKHYSAHQRAVSYLCDGLDEDYCKSKTCSSTCLPSSVALIQVGVYTEIFAVDPWPVVPGRTPMQSLHDFEFYRFIYSYPLKRGTAKAPIKPSSPLSKVVNYVSTWVGHRSPHRYRSVPGATTQGLAIGKRQYFSIPTHGLASGTSYRVTGNIHCVILFAQ